MLLADLFILSTKSRNYQRNVAGPRFGDLHEFFQQHYASLDQMTDEVAERIRALGSKAPGTIAEFLQPAELKEEPQSELDADGMITDLLLAHEEVIRRVRVDVKRSSGLFGDEGTGRSPGGCVLEHMAWMLRSLLHDKQRVSQSAARHSIDPADQLAIHCIVYKRTA